LFVIIQKWFISASEEEKLMPTSKRRHRGVKMRLTNRVGNLFLINSILIHVIESSVNFPNYGATEVFVLMVVN
jgi:hypothetical protein